MVSLTHLRAAAPRAGHKLDSVADHILDTQVPYGDAAYETAGGVRGYRRGVTRPGAPSNAGAIAVATCLIVATRDGWPRTLQPGRRIAVHAITSRMPHWLAPYCVPAVSSHGFR